MGLFNRDEHADGDDRAITHARGSQTTAAGSPHTVIAADNRFEGTLYGSGEVQVEGEIVGAVDISSGLMVASQGTIRGTVSARRVIVAGTVVGDISASERIELKPSAKVEGNMASARILINDGATFDGQVLMREARPGDGKGGPSVTTSSARRDRAGKGNDAKRPATKQPDVEPAADAASSTDDPPGEKDR